MGKKNAWHALGKSKYVLTLIAFGVIIVFLDQNSLIKRWEYKQEILRLQEEINKYKAEYEEANSKLEELANNPDAIERIAREKYLMKKPDEDIFVFDNH